MTTTSQWIDEAMRTLALAEQVRRVEEPERSDILRRVSAAFLQTAGVTFWWEHLKVAYSTWATERGYEHLLRLVPDPASAAWLIAGLEDGDDQKVVYECPPALAGPILAACPAFEYALVDPALNWMVIENHHDVLIAVGAAAERLDRLRG